MTNAQETIFPYLLKEYLIYFIGFLAVTVIVLFLILIVHKIKTEKKERRKRRFTDDYRTAITQYLKHGAPLSLSPESDLQFSAFADVCIDMLEGAANSGKIKALLKEAYVVEHFRKAAASPSWTQRFHAMEILGFFMIDELKGFFKEAIERENIPEVKSKALWALSMIAEKEDLDPITSALSTEVSTSSKFNVYIYGNTIASCRKRGTSDAIITFLRNMKEDRAVQVVLKRDLIEACGASGLKEAASLISYYFSSDPVDPLMRIACLRSLSSLGSLDAGITMKGLMDKDWRVRAVAARASHAFNDAVMAELQRLLYDSVYIVRINAARALRRAGEKGVSILEKERHSGDGFVRDTASFILQEKTEGACLKV